MPSDSTETYLLAGGVVLGGLLLGALLGRRSSASTGSSGTIFTIVLENHSYSQIVGSPSMPYLNQLGSAYLIASNYRSSIHPSLPNYLLMTSGSTQGITDDNYHALSTMDHIFSQMDAAGIDWRAYAESMGSSCNTQDSYLYASRHNPAVYYQSVLDNDCSKVLDFSQFDGSALPPYVWITPNLQNDLHDGTQAQGDAWLSSVIPQLMASSGYQNGGVIFVLFDEGGASADPSQLPAFVISERLAQKGTIDATPYTHKSYLAAVQDLLGLPRLATTMASNSMA